METGSRSKALGVLFSASVLVSLEACSSGDDPTRPSVSASAAPEDSGEGAVMLPTNGWVVGSSSFRAYHAAKLKFVRADCPVLVVDNGNTASVLWPAGTSLGGGDADPYLSFPDRSDRVRDGDRIGFAGSLDDNYADNVCANSDLVFSITDIPTIEGRR